MICPRCLLRAPAFLSHSRPSPSTISTLNAQFYPRPRHFTISSSNRADRKPVPADVAEQSTQQRTPPAATSTSSAQPFSTPHVPSPEQLGTQTTASDPKAGPSIKDKPSHPQQATPAVTSSVAAGTVLKGINYFKNKPDPVALEDSEYPTWLWGILSEKKKDYIGGGREEMDPRLFSRSAKARRMARKRARQDALMNPESLKKKTPLYAQSIDLPGDGDEEASWQGVEAREELTKAMRGKRRKDIKEANFLESMR